MLDEFRELMARASAPFSVKGAGQIELQPHQQRVRDRVKKQLDETGNARLLLYHGLGSGKTISSIAAADAAGIPFTAAVPASLRPNYLGEIEKTQPDTPIDVISHEAFAKGGIPEGQGLIVDESHRLRNQSSARGGMLQRVARHTPAVMLLSGAPIVNTPGDLAAAVGALTGKPISAEDFEERFVDSSVYRPGLLGKLLGRKEKTAPVVKNEDELRELLKDKVDYHAAAVSPAEVTRKVVPVSMSTDQERLYQGMFRKMPKWVHWKIKHDYPMTPEELRRLIGFMTGPRQVGLSTLPMMRGRKNPERAFKASPKLMAAAENLKSVLQDNPDAKALVFSNYIEAGLAPYAAALAKAKIPAGVFSGQLNDTQRAELIKNYNEGKLKALLLGPSGTEGLSTKGTRLVQLLDPHWNDNRTRQSVGRAVRFDSHTHLDPSDRNVMVEEYRARLPRTLLDRLFGRYPEGRPATDDYLARRAEERQRVNDQFLNILKSVGSS
jgi:superfamily II DNA or RNA helicase